MQKYEKNTLIPKKILTFVVSLNVFNMKIRNIFCLLCSSLVLLACDNTASLTPEEQASRVAEDFAQAYFNYDFSRAAKYCDESGTKWLKFAASQLTEADVKKLNAKNAAEVSVQEFVRDENGGYAVVRVSDFLKLGAVNSESQVVSSETFRILLSSTTDKDGNERWEVRMAYPPQSEK